jgi:hypothetical protein
MKEGDFDGRCGPVPVGFSGDQLHFGVEAFDNARGILLFGTEVIEDLSMRMQFEGPRRLPRHAL